ncbi:hypothetical protein [Parasediminibacterium sp. JCM 36343]|uniref:hypothetical protein n=1 Tax=Parasediminibacterium sp. JCM 36343 TaxID=3374279 RepID=UPI00397B4A92
MGAKKIFHEPISESADSHNARKLTKVVPIAKDLEEEKRQEYLKLIHESYGMFAGSLSSTDEFMKSKQEEKLLED